MKNPTFVLFLMGTLNFCSAQGNYSKLILNDGVSIVRNEALLANVLNNCRELASLSSWNNDISKCNDDQCKLYSDYNDFSVAHLKWVDEVKMESQFDAAAGMEVELIRFYSDGKEIEPKSFISTKLEKCKGLQSKQSLTGCAQYMSELALQCKTLVEQSISLQESSQKMLADLQENLTKELEDLKGSRNPSDVKKVKEKKNQLNCVKLSAENSSILIPGLIRTIHNDHIKILAVSKTLKKLEKGL